MTKPTSTGAPTATITFAVALPESGFVFHAPLPETLTQHNVESVTGVPASRFLASLAACGLPVSRLGKLRLVDRAGYVAWLRSLTSTVPRDRPNEAKKEDGADVLLRSLGYEPTGRATPRKPRGGKAPA